MTLRGGTIVDGEGSEPREPDSLWRILKRVWAWQPFVPGDATYEELEATR